ncbi:cytochrome P450, partial [Streptomyces sp. MCAF7]
MVPVRLRGAAVGGGEDGIRETGRLVHRAFSRSDVPFTAVAQGARGARGVGTTPGRPPVFQCLFALQDNAPPRLELPGVVAAHLRQPYAALPLELHLEVWPDESLTMALTDPPRHRALREQVADRFSERCARSLAGEMRAEIRSVVTRAVESGSCDVVHDIGARLSSHNIGRLLGVAPEDRERLLTWTTEAFESGKPLTSHLELMRCFIDMMYARMEKPADDAMGMLVDNEVQGELLTETEILLSCENLVGAAENAGLSMASGILALAAHPQAWQRLVRERDGELVRTAAEEVLRWTSSATHSMRTATADTVVQDRRIAAGDRVVLWIPSANRDESVFPEPERFDLGRRPNRHLALGTG